MLFYQTMLSFNFCLFHCIIYWYYVGSHRIYACIILLFYTLIGSFWLLKFAHPGICMLFCWSGIWSGSHALRRSQSFFCLILQFWYLFLLILINSVILYILDSTFIPFRLFMEYFIMCRNYMSYCSDFNAYIVDWYSLLRLLQV